MKRIVPLLLLSTPMLLAVPRSVRAQETDAEMWTYFSVSGRWKNGLRFYAEIQPRLGDDYHRNLQTYLRTAFGWQLTPEFSVWAGYAWTPTLFPRFRNEDRWYGQFLWELHPAGFDLKNRIRIEARSVAEAGNISYRLRDQVRMEKVLDHSKRWRGIVQSEILWSLNSTPRGNLAGLDSIRVFGGFNYRLTRRIRTEMGYQAAFVNLPRASLDRRLDTLILSFNYDL